ncbi:MAG TPA: hypothetical protein VIT68_00245, partial [Candidatus Gracilibacteria bacterium]
GSSTPEAPKEFPFEVKGVKIIKEQDLARESVADSSDQAVEVPVKKKEAGEKKVPDWLKE